MLKMTACDNPTSVGNKYVGITAHFNYNGKNFTFGSMYSSTVQSIVREKNTLTIQTKNTKYIFEIE